MLPDPVALRTQMRTRRAGLSAAERVAAANGVAISLDALPEFHVDQRIAGYWAVGGEMPLHAAVARLNARGQQYCLPIVGKDRRLRFALLKPGANLKPNRYGIPEPECAAADLLAPDDIDLVLLPLTAFDRSGRRIGMGGGWYDRSFAFLRDVPRPAQPLLVGIGYAFQEVATLPARDWDVALDFIATENELIDCTPLESRP
ncbi:MAG: 5-formyltetrahydrofolate cyclo-ligase [Rudaea sp.]|uniref:5-formyltetrahydrofolate cyclo-ligase n=1 Tax=Rudaea sp. TaxID=2136325 RepID=UPI0039E48E55